MASDAGLKPLNMYATKVAVDTTRNNLELGRPEANVKTAPSMLMQRKAVIITGFLPRLSMSMVLKKRLAITPPTIPIVLILPASAVAVLTTYA
jgi:hypothetical protein